MRLVRLEEMEPIIEVLVRDRGAGKGPVHDRLPEGYKERFSMFQRKGDREGRNLQSITSLTFLSQRTINEHHYQVGFSEREEKEMTYEGHTATGSPGRVAIVP